MLGSILRKIGLLGPKPSADSSDWEWPKPDPNITDPQMAQFAAFGPEMKALFHASNMAAGPCPHAAQIDGKLFDPATAPIPPFEDCTHPDQCACMYQARLELD